MKVILHIGTEKTGSSSIQEFLLQNKESLASQGFFYLHMNGRNEYRDIPAYCMKKSRLDNYFRMKRITDTATREKFDRQFLSSFKQRIRLIPDSIHTVLISSEHFSSRLRSSDELNTLKQLLEPHFSSVHVICYLRDQAKKLCSGYSTRIKSGGRLSFDHYYSQHIENMGQQNQYDVKLCLWEQAFGFKNVTVRLFEPSYFVDENLLSDFCSICHNSLFGYLTSPIQPRNVALSRLGCEIMRRVNIFFPMLVRRIRYIERFRLYIANLIGRFIQGNSVMLSSDQTVQVSLSFEQSNARVCEKYFPERKQLFRE